MYSYEERMEAVRLYIDCNFSFAVVKRKLGYPKQYTSLRGWYEEYEATSELKDKATRKARYTKEQIRRAVRYYMKYRNIAKTLRDLNYPSRPLLKLWISQRYPDEFADKESKRPAISIDKELKEQAVIDYYEGDISITDIADKYKVSRAAIYKWVEKITPNGIKAYESSEDIDNLKREIRRLRMERDILEEAVNVIKKDKGISSDNLNNAEKVMVIDALRDKYGLAEVLALIKMPKSTYMYNKRIKARSDNYAALRLRIRQAFIESYATYGYRRIRACVRKDDGTFYSGKLIRRLMSEENLIAGTYTEKYSSYKGEISPAPENIVNRAFRADRPNEKWLTDITEFGIPAGKVYLSPIIDCYDGMPVAWSIGTSPSSALVGNMLSAAVKTLKSDEKPIIHSDRGWHYRDINWIKKADRAGLIRSMSRKGCSADNSACEGFFGRLKNEIFYNHSWVGVSIKKFTEIINGYMFWYAAGRIKESLGGLSPLQYRVKQGVI